MGKGEWIGIGVAVGLLLLYSASGCSSSVDEDMTPATHDRLLATGGGCAPTRRPFCTPVSKGPALLLVRWL